MVEHNICFKILDLRQKIQQERNGLFNWACFIEAGAHPKNKTLINGLSPSQQQLCIILRLSQKKSRIVGEKMEGEDEDIVCLDSFFINDNYELTRFTFGSQILELYCLHSATTDFDLTGQMVWPGAELLNNYLSENADMLRGSSLVELGSGVGITGILCSRFCKKVVMTDHNDEVLKILTRNIELHDSTQNLLSSAELEAEKLEWGNSEQLDKILQRHPQGFDLVLGADICFQQSNIPLLFDTVEKLLQFSRGKKCRFILAYVSRTKVMDGMVISEATRHGLRISEIAGTRATVRNLQGCIYEITCG